MYCSRWYHLTPDDASNAGLGSPSTCRTQSQRSEPGAAAGASAAPADVEDSRKDITMRMYDGHDMSSHEVVVRSLLEVLQEFDDASDGDRTVRMISFRGAEVIRLVYSCVCCLHLQNVVLGAGVGVDGGY